MSRRHARQDRRSPSGRTAEVKSQAKTAYPPRALWAYLDRPPDASNHIHRVLRPRHDHHPLPSVARQTAPAIASPLPESAERTWQQLPDHRAQHQSGGEPTGRLRPAPSLREPGQVVHCQGLAATRRRRRSRVRSSPGPPRPPRSAQDHRAISVPLARVMRGQPRSLGTTKGTRSAALAAATAPLPKLIVRVRFSSPAPGKPRSRRSRESSSAGTHGHSPGARAIGRSTDRKRPS
jgi:hypothetical protein